METQKICPNCRKPLLPDVPLGLCPECLIKSGFPTGTEPGVSGEAAGERFVPPPVEEIARLFPQLEILGFIGKGGMGAVYKARQPALDRFVALKVLPPAVAGDPGFAERFNREARALARLNHPNIVAVHDFGQAGTLHYLVMEFVDGTNLREVEHAGKLSPEQALAIVPQICEALQFAHNEGIVHRDIKPENLLMDKKGRVKITDFGIAKIVGAPAGKVSLTGVKDVVGTPHYMAPEQIEKPLTVDHRADIYSLGVVFYEMLTGELPLGKFQPPSKKVQVDVRLDEVVLHALEKEPERRYQQASQVKTAVETITGTPPPMAGSAISPPATSTPAAQTASDKTILPALLLAFPFGLVGAHRFYVGKIWTAFLQLGALGGCILLIIACATTGGTFQPTLGILLGFLICGCFFWAVIDWILILCKAFTDGQGRRITHWLHPQTGDMKTGISPLTGPPSTPPPGGTAPSTVSPQPAPIANKRTPAPGTGMIVAPAVGLMVVALWKLLSAFPALFLLTGGSGWLGKLVGGGNFLGEWGSLAIFSVLLFKIIPGLLILFGGYQMLQRRSYAWAIAAGIVSIVACSLIGLPIGIWALIVLARDDVKSAFNSNMTAAPLAPNPGRFGRRFAMIAGGIVLILIAVALVAAMAVRFVPALGKASNRAGEITEQNLQSAGIYQDAGGTFRKDSSQSFPLSADGGFSLDNVKGRIEIHGWSSNAVVINAAIHGKTSESVEAVHINIDSNPDEATVHTEQPSSVTGFPWSWLWFKNDKRNDADVDYTIQVPRNARLKKISSVNGRIVIEDVSGDIEASAVNGEVQSRGTRGDLKLSTVNGRIEAELSSLGGSQSVSLSTVNGAIEATLPANADAAVSASTVNGGLSSEFPALVVNKEFPLGRNLKGTLGNGSASVEVSTVNGRINFRRGKPAAAALPASHPDSEAEQAANQETAPGEVIDPATGLPTGLRDAKIDPSTGLPLPATGATGAAIDPATGLPMSPGETGTIDPNTGLPATPDAAKSATNAVVAAQKWLALIDRGNYSESWKEASAIFQGAVTETAWENSMTTFRKPLGNLVSREVKSAQLMTEMPGAPDGKYVVMQFNTSFAAKKSAIETVTFMLEKDGHWKAAGYYIK